jgi:hypothetical protein
MYPLSHQVKELEGLSTKVSEYASFEDETWSLSTDQLRKITEGFDKDNEGLEMYKRHNVESY